MVTDPGDAVQAVQFADFRRRRVHQVAVVGNVTAEAGQPKQDIRNEAKEQANKQTRKTEHNKVTDSVWCPLLLRSLVLI